MPEGEGRKLFEFDWGYLVEYGDNELAIVSTIKDPPKIRLAVKSDLLESNLGGVTFNVRRDDGKHEEYAYVNGRMTAAKNAGALYLATRGPGEAQPTERLYVDDTVAIFRVPIQAPGISTFGSVVAPPAPAPTPPTVPPVVPTDPTFTHRGLRLGDWAGFQSAYPNIDVSEYRINFNGTPQRWVEVVDAVHRRAAD